MNSIKKALVVGATGLIGRSLVEQLQLSAACEAITVLTRQYHLAFDQLSKVTQVVLTDFFMLGEEDVSQHSHVFSCLGSTIQQAGSKENFYNIDFGLNAHIAELIQNQATQLILVSALGANAQSQHYYLRTKGELENYLQTLKLDKISILRPSLLIGERPAQRPLEALTQRLFLLTEKFLPQRYAYKPVTALQVAQTMVVIAQSQTEAFKVYDNLAIQQISSGRQT